MAIDRIKSGIPGLDELINGGFPRESLILLSGSAGTGKTIFGLQSLCEGAKHNENGVYLTFEEPAEIIVTCGDELGLGLKGLVEENKIKIIDYAKFEEGEHMFKKDEEKIEARGESFYTELKDSINEIGAKRLVIDSLSSYMLYDGDKATLHRFIRAIRRFGVTTLLIAEAKESKEQLVEYLEGLESVEFMVDGVIKLVAREGAGERRLTIRKMRGTKHEIIPLTMEITEGGIIIESG